MDNLTHSLIGLVAGETVARTLPADAGLPVDTRRSVLLWMGIAGGNLPDLDLLWSMSTVTGDRLGYLLEHRGHTHTLLGCALLAALLYVCTMLWLRFRSIRTGPHDRLTLALMAFVSVALHLGMDALNSYGVHPFWPWNNHWFYGDAVFIIEPLYWLAAAPLLFVMRTGAARVLLALILLVASAAVFFVHRFHLMGWGAPLLAALLAVFGRRMSPRAAAWSAAATMAAVGVVFIAAGQMATRRVDALARDFPDSVTLDKVLSPLPTHPLCWDVLLVQAGKQAYAVRHGLLSIAMPPSASDCPQFLARKGTAPMVPVSAPDSPEMHWLGEFSMPRARLIAIAAHDCATRELMQFVRAPFAIENDRRWVLGDLRFDREEGAGMAELEIDADRVTPCRYDVPWIPPRADLLEPSG